MRKEFLIGSILALGLGIAQAQTMPAPMQGGTQSASRPQSSHTEMGTPPTPTATMGPVGTVSSQNNAPQSFTGCLTRTSNGWSLATDQDHNISVNGADNQLSQFSNQQVNIQGVQTSDGGISVSSINKVSDSCSNNGQAASTSEAQGTATQPSSAGAATGETNAVSNSQSQNGAATQTTPPVAERPGVVPSDTTKTGEMNPPPGTPAVTSETAPTTVGSGAPADRTASANSVAGTQSTTTADRNAAQNPPASATDQSTTSQTPPNAADQSSMSSQTSQTNAATPDQTNPGATTPDAATTSNNDQNAGVAQSGANSNQNAGKAGEGAAASSNQNGTTDQNGVRHITDLPQNGEQTSRLPQTASPLPLLGLLGIGSFGAGLLSWRKK